MADHSAARRYAKAFLELVPEGMQTDIAREFRRVIWVLESTELLSALSNPVFTPAERRSVLHTVLPRLRISPLLENLIQLTLDKGRFGQLPEIATLFEELVDEQAGRARVRVETAEAMSPELEAEVRAALGHVTGKEVVLETVVKPELIGGIVARVGSQVYDASVRSRLEHIRQTLISAQLPAEA